MFYHHSSDLLIIFLFYSWMYGMACVLYVQLVCAKNNCTAIAGKFDL